MEELLALLKDGHARSVEGLALELGTTAEDIRRRLEFLEHAGIIRKVSWNVGGCGSCGGCPGGKGAGDGSAPACKGCVPDGGFRNMGGLWEVV